MQGMQQRLITVNVLIRRKVFFPDLFKKIIFIMEKRDIFVFF